MRKSAMIICMALICALAGAIAFAGNDYTQLDVAISRLGNGKSVAAEIESGYKIRLMQTGPIRFMRQPNGEVIAPLWLEIEPMDCSPTASTRTAVSLEGATVNLMDVAHLTQRKKLTLLVDLMHADGMKYRVFVPEAIDKGHTIHISYEGSEFHSAYILRVREPAFSGIRVNENESRDNYLVLEMEKGVPIPYPSKWSFYTSRNEMGKGWVETPVEVDAIEGWMRKDKNGRYLPPDDKRVLAQYPELKNKCIITYTHFNEDGTSSYFVIEGRWPEEE